MSQKEECTKDLLLDEDGKKYSGLVGILYTYPKSNKK